MFIPVEFFRYPPQPGKWCRWLGSKLLEIGEQCSLNVAPPFEEQQLTLTRIDREDLHLLEFCNANDLLISIDQRGISRVEADHEQ